MLRQSDLSPRPRFTLCTTRVEVHEIAVRSVPDTKKHKTQNALSKDVPVHIFGRSPEGRRLPARKERERPLSQNTFYNRLGSLSGSRVPTTIPSSQSSFVRGPPRNAQKKDSLRYREYGGGRDGKHEW